VLTTLLNDARDVIERSLAAIALRAPREFNAALLPAQHCEHRFDVRARAGEQVVIEHVPAVSNRQ
jgi:hypothetical protein